MPTHTKVGANTRLHHGKRAPAAEKEIDLGPLIPILNDSCDNDQLMREGFVRWLTTGIGSKEPPIVESPQEALRLAQAESGPGFQYYPGFSVRVSTTVDANGTEIPEYNFVYVQDWFRHVLQSAVGWISSCLECRELIPFLPHFTGLSS